MLLFTPELQESFEWFYATHELTMTGGGLMWHRIALPAAGGIGDQDAKLMETIEHVREVVNAIVWGKGKKKPTGRPVTTNHG